MRTTITLDADVDLAVRRLMRERGLSFKAAVNEAIRSGIRPRTTGPAYRTRPVAMGAPAVPLDKALRLASQLEEDELIRKLALRK
jgi:hypothetical protein